MARKIVILNGSPRAKGNTSALINAFTEGAESAGHQVTTFHLHTMNIHPCQGCCKGGKDPASPCVQKDDMEQIYTAYLDADVIVFASPLYCWTISGQLKVTLDRLFAVSEADPRHRYPRRDCALLMAGGSDGFEETVIWYRRLVNHIGWTDLGTVLCGGVRGPGKIAGNPRLEEAKELGQGV